MRKAEESQRENDPLRERLAKPSEAGLQINESLHLQAVLQEVLDSAQALTGAATASSSLLTSRGRTEDLLTSVLSPQEEEILATPEGARLFEYFSAIQDSLPLSDLSGYVRAMGTPARP